MIQSKLRLAFKHVSAASSATAASFRSFDNRQLLARKRIAVPSFPIRYDNFMCRIKSGNVFFRWARATKYGVIALLASSILSLAQDSIAENVFSQTPYIIIVPRRTVDAMVEITKTDLSKSPFKDVFSLMISGQINKPIRKDGAIWQHPFVHGNINYLLPSPHNKISGITNEVERLPSSVSCMIQNVPPRTLIHCRVFRAYLGPDNRWLDIQWWHDAHDIPPEIVHTRFLELFTKLRHQPASSK